LQSDQSLNSSSVFSKILAFRHINPLSLYRGLGIACLFHAPALSIYLSTYDGTKEQLLLRLGKGYEENPLIHLFSGLVAEVASGIFWTPMEVIKQRMQITAIQTMETAPSMGIKGSTHNSATNLMLNTIKNEGLRGLYRGYWVTLGVFVPYSMVYFLCYERFKIMAKGMLNVESTNDLPLHGYCVSSFFAGAIGGAVANPFDVVKTRWQLQTSGPAQELHVSHPSSFQVIQNHKDNSWRSSQSAPYKSPLDVVLRTYREEGLRAFGKGMGARVLWIAPSVAISMSLYEEFKKVIEG